MYMYIYTIVCDRNRKAGGGVQGTRLPHFSPQMQFLTAFLDHKVTKSCKVTESCN